jgi:hypothetical protein
MGLDIVGIVELSRHPVAVRIAARISSSRARARSTSLSPPAVKTSEAPYARMIFLRSSLMPSA